MSASVHDRFAEAVRRWPERPFLNVLPETAEALHVAAGVRTYGEMGRDVAAVAKQYDAAGYGPGHRVGLLLGNRPAFLVHWLALNRVGAGIVPINPALRRAELSYLAAHSEMVLAIAVANRQADLIAARPGLVVIDPEDPVPSAPKPHGVPGDDPECALLYTSGTTGDPKGCMLGNAYFLHCGDWYASVGGALTLHKDPQERILTPLPLFHVNALAFSVMVAITVGGCLTLLDRFHPATWWASVRAAEATIIHYLGIMPPLWMTAPPDPSDRQHSVRAGFGAGIDRKLHVAAEERFGFPLVEGWAMTETGAGGVIMATCEPRKPGTAAFGRPGPGVEARVVAEDGQEAGADEPGELQVRRAGQDPRRFFFSGYLKDPEATEAAWAGGWLSTGDIVVRDSDGDLHFIDRKKNVIRRSGENISAVEVESVLTAHSGVHQVAVAPVEDALRGEEVVALVVPADQPDPETLVHWCLQELAYFKAPGWVAFVDELPLTATEKLQRGALGALVAEVFEASRVHDMRHLKRPV